MNNRMKRVIVSGLAVLIVVTGMSQSLPKKSCMRLQGYINDKVEVTMNLVKINDSIYADFYLTPTGQSGKEYGELKNSPLIVGGVVGDDGSFTLREPYNRDGIEFRGKFVTRQSVTGTWKGTKSGPAFKFSLTENYPSGSLPLSVWFQVATKPLVSKSLNPRAYIEQCLIVPTLSSDPVRSDSIRNTLMTIFAAKSPQTTDPQLLLNSLQQAYFNNYLSDNLDLYKQMPDAGSLNWDLYKLMHIVYNDRHLLSFCIESYAFTGGAHGLGAQNFTVINTRTGDIVTAGDLFVKNYKSILTPLLTAKLKQMEMLGPSDKLSDKSDFFVDEIVPNDNFYITGNGIGFFYNHYEIAPYSRGFTEIFLTFSELRPALKPGGPADAFLK